MKKLYFVMMLTIAFLIVSCEAPTQKVDVKNQIDEIAKEYVILVLQLGKYDENYVDAYFGPDEHKEYADKNELPLDSLLLRAQNLLSSIDKLENIEEYEYRVQNLRYFAKAMIAHTKFLSGEKFTFDQESKAIYGAVAPTHDSLYYKNILKEIDVLLPPGDGGISERFEEYKKPYIVPADKIDTVFKLAIEEVRRRSKEHISLPVSESFTSELVQGKPWGAYNWFKGDFTSLIQVNTELPFAVNKALHLASHEGYPGHHVFHSMIEADFVKENNWIEYSVYPLFSPVSIISEGTANAAQAILFTPEEEIAFEKEVLCKVANIDTNGYSRYKKVLKSFHDLGYIGNDAARYYLDGEMTKEETIEYLVKYGCRSAKRAEMNISFYETYRAYVISYSLGQDLVENYIDAMIERGEAKDKWDAFIQLIKKPIMPQKLIAK